MLGTIVNALSIICGGVLGVMLKRGIPESLNNALIKTMGLVVVIVGINGVIVSMIDIDPESVNATVLLLISLVAGCVVGELLRIDDRLNDFGQMIEKRAGKSGFAKGFVSASVLFGVGAMSIVGAINDGLSGDSGVLFLKSALDGIISIILAASLGFGVIFSAVTVFVWQGSVSLLAGLIAPFVSNELLNIFSMVGYAIIMAIGFNFLCDTKIKIANLSPALIFPVGYYFLFYS